MNATNFKNAVQNLATVLKQRQRARMNRFFTTGQIIQLEKLGEEISRDNTQFTLFCMIGMMETFNTDNGVLPVTEVNDSIESLTELKETFEEVDAFLQDDSAMDYHGLRMNLSEQLKGCASTLERKIFSLRCYFAKA